MIKEALKLIVLAAFAMIIIIPFWRSTEKPLKNDANNFESNHSQPNYGGSSDSHSGGGDFGGSH